MDISSELAQPGPEGAALAVTYSLIGRSRPENDPGDMVMQQLFVIRFIIDGEWLHCTSGDQWLPVPKAALWGGASKMMKLRCHEPYRVFSIGLRSAAWMELCGLPMSDFADRITPIEPILGATVTHFQSALQQARDMESMANLADAWLASLKRGKVRSRLIERARIFETYVRYRWERPIGEIADEFGLSTRQLERMTKQCTGFKPKLLTRRHRFLNIAAAMRGIGDTEWQELCYRYYSDQSHMSREFRKFAGMSPGDFREAHAPLLDATLRFRETTYQLLKSAEEQNRPPRDLPPLLRTI